MPAIKDGFTGCFFGLVADNAPGTTLVFNPPGTFEPTTEIAGDGTYSGRIAVACYGYEGIPKGMDSKNCRV